MYTAEEVRELRIPQLKSRYPLKRSVHYESIRDECNEWFLSYGLIEREEHKRIFIEMDFPYLMSVVYPAATRRRLRDLCLLSAALTVRDDEVDRDRFGKGLELILAYLASTRSGYTSGEPRWEPMMAEIWRSFAEYLSPQQVQRLTNSVEVYLEGCLGSIKKGATFSTIDEYLLLRRKSIGQGVDHVMVEVSLGIDLPSDVQDHPLFRGLNLCDIDRVIVYQDILSCKKELTTEQENIVSVIASSRGCSLQEAVNLACERFQAEMSRFDRLCEQLKTSSLAEHRDVLRYAGGLHDFTAGLIEWTSRSVRYTRQCKSNWSTDAILIRDGQEVTRSTAEACGS